MRRTWTHVGSLPTSKLPEVSTPLWRLDQKPTWVPVDRNSIHDHQAAEEDPKERARVRGKLEEKVEATLALLDRKDMDRSSTVDNQL